MKIQYELKLPSPYEGAKEMTKVLGINAFHKGYTIGENLEILHGNCSIESDGSYNYHNNYDDSKNVMMFEGEKRWWTLNPSRAKEIQGLAIKQAVEQIEMEKNRLLSCFDR